MLGHEIDILKTPTGAIDFRQRRGPLVEITPPTEGEFAGKRVIVTGVSKEDGFGRFIANGFARAGARAVIFNCTEESAALAEDRSDELEALGTQPLWVPGDLRDEATALRIIDSAKSNFDGIDIIVHNAAFNNDQPFTRMTAEDWDDAMNINARSAFLMAKAAARPGGLSRDPEEDASLVLMGSPVYKIGGSGNETYVASKGALYSLNKSFASELGRYGIRSNMVLPGEVETAMGRKMRENVRQMLKDGSYLQRFPTQEDIANAVLFLASPRARNITGQVLAVDAGQTDAFGALAGLIRAGYEIVPKERSRTTE